MFGVCCHVKRKSWVWLIKITQNEDWDVRNSSPSSYCNPFRDLSMSKYYQCTSICFFIVFRPSCFSLIRPNVSHWLRPYGAPFAAMTMLKNRTFQPTCHCQSHQFGRGSSRLMPLNTLTSHNCLPKFLHIKMLQNRNKVRCSSFL